jgi:membrane-bound acyltransferase YfiQ involved in biofilm formation
MMYEAPLGYSIEDVRPAGGVKKFQSAAYSNVKIHHNDTLHSTSCFIFILPLVLLEMLLTASMFSCVAVRKEAILISLLPSSF